MEVAKKLMLRKGQERRATVDAELVEDGERGCRTPKDVRGTRQARQRDGFEQVCAEGTISCRCVRSEGFERSGAWTKPLKFVYLNLNA